MAVKDTVKQYFRTGQLPTQTQFYELFDGVRWKEEKLGITEVTDLVVTLNNISSNNALSQRISDISYSVADFKLPADVDDTLSINRALLHVHSLGGGKVWVPYKATPYVISSTLTIYGNTTLEVDTFTTIFLASHSNCKMLENANKSTLTNMAIIDRNISIIGGIWDGNGSNGNQTKYDDLINENLVTGFLFSGVDTLIFKPTKVYDTRTYAVLFGNVHNVLVQNVNVDIPIPPAMDNKDGLHFLGPASNIVIRDCMIKSDDNAIALNADDANHGIWTTHGIIENVIIDSVVMNECNQGILLLSGNFAVNNVTITNINGACAYLVCLKTWNFGPGKYGNIQISNTRVKWRRMAGGARTQFYVYLEGLIDSVSFKNIVMPEGDGEGYDKGFYICKESCPQTIIQKLVIDGFESNSITNVGGTPSFVFANDVTINDCTLNNFVSRKSTSSEGVYPLQFINSHINNLIVTNAQITNCRYGILIASNGTFDRIVYRNNMLDNLSNNVIRMRYVASVNTLNVSGSGTVLLDTQDTVFNNLSTDVVTTAASILPLLKVRKFDNIVNSNPAAGAFIGWICLKSGVTVNRAYAENTAFAVNDSVEISGAVFTCKVAGVTTTHPAPNWTAWGGDTVDGTVTWTFYAVGAAAIVKGYGLIEA